MKIPDITQANWDKLIHNPQPVVIEFYAKWCPHCSMMDNIYLRVASRNKSSFLFCKLDIDVSPALSEKLGIETLPTFVICRNGKILGYTAGLLSEKILEDRIYEIARD